MSRFRQESIYGQWKHSFEEDDERHSVYRPASHTFQRSRGRKQFEIQENGAFIDTGPGPTDIPSSQHGHWHLDGEYLVIEYGNGQREQFEIDDVANDKLVLKKS